jgi:hypothetical protein
MITFVNIVRTQTSFLRGNPLYSNFWQVLLMEFVFIYLCWFSTRFSYPMIVVSFNNNSTEITSGIRIAYPSETPTVNGVSTVNGCRVARSLVFCIVLCGILVVFHGFYFDHCILRPYLMYVFWLTFDFFDLSFFCYDTMLNCDDMNMII